MALPAMLVHTGTGTPLTVGTRAEATAPMATSHRTGFSSAMPNQATTRETTASAAAPGPETPTDEHPPLASTSALRPPQAL